MVDPWVAVSFGCCASAELREEKAAALRANGPVEMRICYDQPRAVELPRAEPEHTRPATSHSVSRHVSQWVMSGRDTMSRASIRTSSSTVRRPWAGQSKSRPSISGPTDFRRVDGLDAFQEEEPMPIRRRRSFRPLELSIYVDNGRLSPLPDFTDSEWTKLPAGLEIPAQARVRSSSRSDSISSNTSYLIQRKPVGSNRSSTSSTISRPPSTHLLQTSFCESPIPIQRSGTMSSLASPLTPRARSATDFTLPKRGSLRRTKTDVDDAIRELNTIVEERRANTLHNPSSATATSTHHIPAIAPSLRMHVRSETLSDIGSAFSVPFVSKPLSTPPLPASRARSQSSSPTPSASLFATRSKKLKLVPPPLPRPGPLNSNPITPPTPTIPTPTTPLGRLGAWLKRSIPSSPTTPNAPTSTSSYKISKPIPQENSAPTPLYQCVPKDSTCESGASASGLISHTRQASAETGTVTLVSCPSTPALSSRAASPAFEDEEGRWRFGGPGSPETPDVEKGRFEVVVDRGSTLKEMGVDVKMVGEGFVSPVSPVSPVGVAF